MTTNDIIKKYEAAGNELSCETEELIEYPRDLYEAAHEHADGHEDVIYYSKAHDCIKGAYSEEKDHAEQQMTDCCCYDDSPDYDTIATRLAFWITEYRYTELVRGECEEFKEWLEDNELDESEAYEAVETILN